MRNLKRVLTIVMAIAMMMSLMTVGAGAAFPDQDKVTNTDAVNMNVALGIIQGRDDGKFDPAGNVTRGEMAKMICIALNGGTEPSLGTQITPSYTDIKGHWAEKYVEYCTNFGIVAGMGNGTFAPDANVTGTQAAKMLLVAIGYAADKESFNGAKWSISINARASQKGLYSGMAIDPGAALNRDNAAQMVSNALEATMVFYDYELVTVGGHTVGGQISTISVAKDDEKGKTILSDKFKLITGYGVLESVNYNKSTKKYDYNFTSATVAGPDYVSAKNLKDTSIATSEDFSALYGQQVKALYKIVGGKTTVFGMYAYESTVVATGISDDQGTSTRDGYIKFNGNYYKAENAAGKTTKAASDIAALSFNGAANASTITNLGNIPAYFSVTLLDVDGDGAIDTATYLPYTVKKVTYVGTTSVTAGASYKFDDAKIFDGIKKDAYAKIILAANTAENKDTLLAVDKMVEGKVTASSGEVYTIAGEKYSMTGTADVKVGDVVSKAPCVNTFLFAADTTGSVVINDYAVIVKAAPDSMGVNQVKMLLGDGTKKIYPLGLTHGAVNGNLVTFEINADDDYDLTKAVTAPLNSGFDKVFAAGDKDDIGFSSDKIKYINNWSIADDAVIFLAKNVTAVNTANPVYTNASFEVITGAKLKSLGAFKVGDPAVAADVLVSAYANDNSSTGGSTVQMAYITTNATDVSTKAYQYGYAVEAAGAAYNDANKKVNKLVLWNGKEDVTLMTDSYSISGAVANVKKGDVVQYTLDKDGKLEGVINNISTTVSTNGSALAAITMYDGTYIQINNVGDRLEITKDTVILYVDKETKKGVLTEGTNITLADKDVLEHYIRNAVVLSDDGKDADLIVMETNSNQFLDNSAVTVASTDADTQGKLDALYHIYDTVTLTAGYNGAAIEVPTNKTLVIADGTVADASLITGEANATITFNTDVIITTNTAGYYASALATPVSAGATVNKTYVWADVDSDANDTTMGWLLQ